MKTSTQSSWDTGASRSVWMGFELNAVRPVGGPNTLQFALRERPAGLEGEISIDDVELIVEYDLYAAQNGTPREGAVT